MHGNQFQSAVDLAGCNCADGRPIFCLAWPRPFIVVGVIMAFAALLEALQGLTPDRTPDLPTALAAAAGALTAGGFGLARDPRAKACPGAVKANLMYP